MINANLQLFGGRGGRSGGSSGGPAASTSASSGTGTGGRLNLTRDQLWDAGAHSFAQGTVYFDTGTSKAQVSDLIENGNYVTTGDGSKVLGFDVVGRINSPDYPSRNVMAAGARVRQRSDGTFNLSYPRTSGVETDRSYRTEAAAMRAGRTALRNFLNKQWGK